MFKDNVVNKNVQNKKEEFLEEYEVLSDGIEVYNGYPIELLDAVVVNDSIELKKKHCLESYCITSMKVSY